MKKILLILLVLLIIPVAVMGYFALPWIAIGVGLYRSPDPPMPEITYGEFPFRLVYELNGEIIVVEDVIICKFDGIGMDEGRGKHRKWTRRLASGNDRIILLEIDDTTSIRYTPGGEARYYMGDMEELEILGLDFDNRMSFAHIYDPNDDSLRSTIIPTDKLFEQYGIRLISWEPSPPIVNRFN